MCHIEVYTLDIGQYLVVSLPVLIYLDLITGQVSCVDGEQVLWVRNQRVTVILTRAPISGDLEDNYSIIVPIPKCLNLLKVCEWQFHKSSQILILVVFHKSCRPIPLKPRFHRAECCIELSRYKIRIATSNKR